MSSDLDESAPLRAAVGALRDAIDATELPLDLPEQPTPAAAPKPVRRKRASVPSWDEIVFGGPKS